MKDVIIKKIQFENGVNGESKNGCLDEELMKEFEKSLDTDEVKEIMSVLMKGASNNLNIFEWIIGFSFIWNDYHENDFDDQKYNVSINIKAMQNCNAILSQKLYISKSVNNFLEFKYTMDYIYQNGVEKICKNLLSSLINSKVYMSLHSSKKFNHFKRCSKKIIEEQDRAFKFLDNLNEKFDFKYTKEFSECNLNYLIGEDLILGTLKLDSGTDLDFKNLLKDLIIYKFIMNKIPEEDINVLFESDDIQGIVDNLKVLCY